MSIDFTKTIKTELGELPIDWKVMKISDVGNVVTGSTPNTKKREYYGNEYFFVSPGDIIGDKYVRKTVKKLSEEGFEISRKIPKQSVMMTCIGSTIGKVAMSDRELTTNQQINSIVCNEGFNSEYIYYSLDYYFNLLKEKFIEHQAVPLINKTKFSQFLLPIPNRNEQEGIASILSSWDKAIELKEKLIRQKKELKKGLLQNLLSGKIRWNDKNKCSKKEIKERVEMINKGVVPEGYVNNGFGIYPIDWQLKSFDEIFDFSGSYSIPRNQLSEEGICYLHYGDIHKFDRSFIDVQKKYDTIPKINKDIKTIGEQYLLRDGDIAFADASEDYEGIGKAVTVVNEKNIPFVAGLHTIVAKEKREYLLRDYKKFFTLDFGIRKQIMRYATGISVFGISRENLKKIIVSLPPRLEQQKIAELLSFAETEINHYEREVTFLKEQKKGLMQMLLTGKVRIRV